jgi:hypothetical protein
MKTTEPNPQGSSREAGSYPLLDEPVERRLRRARLMRFAFQSEEE